VERDPGILKQETLKRVSAPATTNPNPDRSCTCSVAVRSLSEATCRNFRHPKNAKNRVAFDIWTVLICGGTELAKVGGHGEPTCSRTHPTRKIPTPTPPAPPTHRLFRPPKCVVKYDCQLAQLDTSTMVLESATLYSATIGRSTNWYWYTFSFHTVTCFWVVVSTYGLPCMESAPA
jgi:hypothetical protein